MFDRLTDRARRVIELAGENARELRAPAVEPAHLLLGMIAEGECLAARALDDAGITRGKILDLAEAQPPAGRLRPVHPAYSFSPATHLVFERCLREALQLGQNWVAAEHLLLAITYLEGEMAPHAAARPPLLERLGCLPIDMRTIVLARFRGEAAQEPAPRRRSESERLAEALAEVRSQRTQLAEMDRRLTAAERKLGLVT